MRAAVALGVAAAAVLTGLTGCSTGDDDRAEERAGALAAAQAYVDAIAALDVEAADAMTDPEAFKYLVDGDNADIRQALPEAVDPIADPWATVASPGWDYNYGTPEYVVQVSYAIGDLTGGDTIELELDEDGDPSDVDDWTITEPLIVYGDAFSDFPTATLGGLELTFGDAHRGVAGYPAGYLLETVEPTSGVDPLWVPVGAADAPPWDDSLPKLSRHRND